MRRFASRPRPYGYVQSTFDLVLLNGITVRVPAQFDAVALRRLVDVMTAR